MFIGAYWWPANKIPFVFLCFFFVYYRTFNLIFWEMKKNPHEQTKINLPIRRNREKMFYTSFGGGWSSSGSRNSGKKRKETHMVFMWCSNFYFCSRIIILILWLLWAAAALFPAFGWINKPFSVCLVWLNGQPAGFRIQTMHINSVFYVRIALTYTLWGQAAASRIR